MSRTLAGPASSVKSASRHVQKHQKYQKLSVGRELADTTWRMTVPVLVFAGIGIFVDLLLGTKPLLTLLGMLVGFGFAIVLVKQQLGRLPARPLSKEALAAIKRRNAAEDAEKDDYYSDDLNKNTVKAHRDTK